jgi:2-polyprenyl-3-methyl-5-hydroxy-6-metoxy-1,4-benzoquinol methylase
VSTQGPLRRLARKLRRLLLPSFDLLLLQRRRFVSLIKPGASVLDAGCGDGTIAFRLARRGCRVVAVSNDAEAIARLEEHRGTLALPPDNLAFRVHDLSEERGRAPFSAEAFDATVCFDVLEHIADDLAALRRIAAALREGGQLLLTAPDDGAPRLWAEGLSVSEDGGHVRRGYARAELEALLEQAGLKALRWAGFGGFFTQKATNVSHRLERRQGAPFLFLRFVWLALLRPLCRLDPLLPWPNYELFVLAEKRT